MIERKHNKTRHEWVGKVIRWKVCKKLKFDHTTKWYVHKPESALKNETHKIFMDFEIQTADLNSARRPYLSIIIKREPAEQ